MHPASLLGSFCAVARAKARLAIHWQAWQCIVLYQFALLRGEFSFLLDVERQPANGGFFGWGRTGSREEMD